MPCAIEPGDPLPALRTEQQALFNAGGIVFAHEFVASEGLGPVYIERSCVSCHAQGGIGGSDSLDDSNHFVQRFFTLGIDGTYNPLESLGGDILQTKSIAGLQPGCGVLPESIPALATITSKRNPQALFGSGLIEAIPDATILGGAVDQGDGVKGRANLDDSGRRPGRFGWKAQGVSLVPFIAKVFRDIMGITTPWSPIENMAQGQPVLPGCSDADVGAPTPNDPDGSFVYSVSAWVALLAPPQPKNMDSEATRGEHVFISVGCNKCHTPTMLTGDYNLPLAGNPAMHIEALSNKPVALYSDLLLHDMGPDLDDQVRVRLAKGRDFRTAPLWGLQLRIRFLHDGRARSPDEAIRMHGGEAQIIRDRYYVVLAEDDRKAVLKFLSRL